MVGEGMSFLKRDSLGAEGGLTGQSPSAERGREAMPSLGARALKVPGRVPASDANGGHGLWLLWFLRLLECDQATLVKGSVEHLPWLSCNRVPRWVDIV